MCWRSAGEGHIDTGGKESAVKELNVFSIFIGLMLMNLIEKVSLTVLDVCLLTQVLFQLYCFPCSDPVSSMTVISISKDL